MKKAIMALSAAMLIFGPTLNAEPPSRTLGGVLKTINRQARQQRPAPKPRAEAVAPANAVEIPFKHTLGKGEADITNLYTQIDANGDGRVWKIGGFTGYSVCMAPNADGYEAMDDWLFSPPLHLLAGMKYEISFDECSAFSAGTEQLSVSMGQTASVEGMTTEIVAPHSFSGNTFQTKTNTLTVPADGYYHVGFHATSPKSTSKNIKLCNFGIKVYTAPVDAPQAGELTYELAPKGELKASVTYTAPKLGQSGEPLTSISKVEIKTNWVVTHTFTDMGPGDTRTFETTLNNDGYNRIEATAYVGDTPGETCIIKDFYAGPDNPLPVTGVNIALSDDYTHVTVSWDPVGETGEKGGYVDTDKVVYYIFDAFGSYYDPALATTTETSYTFDYDLNGQDFVAYQITAGIDETWYSREATTGIVTVGTPDELPWFESFTNGRYAQPWGVDPESSYTVMNGTVHDNELQLNSDDPDAEPVYLNSQDADNGFLFMLPMNKDDAYGIFSAKISLKNASAPALEFYYQGKGSAIDAMISADGGEWATVKTIDLKETPTDDWTMCHVDLNAYKDAEYIQIELRMRAIHNDDEHTWSVPFDNIRIIDVVDKDMRLVALTAPASVEAGNETLLTARIENLGAETATGAIVELYRDGVKTAEKAAGPMAHGEIQTLTFSDAVTIADNEQITYEARINYDGDANPGNDSQSATVSVVMPPYPGVTGLTASLTDGNTVALAWTAPDYEPLTLPEARVEDFENPEYTPLTNQDFGGWTLVDGDGGKTYSFLDDVDNPYRNAPMAFQLYNPVTAGVPDKYLIDIPTHSGDNLLVGWSTNGTNDNWLISPELSGDAQTVSFFARSFSVAYPEEFEVLYSTDGKELENFTVISEVENYPENGLVPEEWTEFKVNLPEGARHFAIHHIAYDTYALYIDDISFSASGTLPNDTQLTGYNIYRNDVKINEEPIAEPTANDTPAADGSYSYRVSAVYNIGESRMCEPVTVEVKTDGITDAQAGDRWRISVDGHTITVSGLTTDTDVTLYNTSGTTVASVRATDGTAMFTDIASGLYLTDFGAKVVVK